MKKSAYKRILSGNRGETLVEGVVSIVLFTLMIVTVTLMISTSLRMSADATIKAGNNQKAVNNVILAAGATRSSLYTYTDTNIVLTSGTQINVTIPVVVIEDGTVTSLLPPEMAGD